MKTTPLNSVMIILSLVLPSLIFAQQGRDSERFNQHRERIESHKIAFISDKLSLTPEEAEKFWPVYNANRDKVETELINFRKKHDYNPEDILILTEEEANEFIQSHLEHEQKMLDMKKAFHKELLGVLSAQKTLRLFKAEEEFRVELMKRVAGSGQGRGRSEF